MALLIWPKGGMGRPPGRTGMLRVICFSVLYGAISGGGAPARKSAAAIDLSALVSILRRSLALF